MCKKIHRGGNAEQYNADKKYKEAVAVAVEKCAEQPTSYQFTRAIPSTAAPDENDPYNMRRLRRATGPHRAAVR